MTQSTATFLLPLDKYDDVSAMLNNGVTAIGGQVPHKGTLDWIKCEVRPDAVERIKALGGEEVTPR